MKRVSLLLTILVSLVVVVGVFAADLWAASVVSSNQGPAYSGVISPARRNPAAALGPADNKGLDETKFFSLGNQGSIIVKLSAPVDQGLEVYEVTWGCNAGYANETAEVWVSPDGVSWTSVGTADNADSAACYNESGFKTTLELDQCIQYVKVVDAGVGTAGDGFDLDAVGGVGECQFPIIVEIDVKPGSDPSCFNSNENGVIPVAILGTADFDVAEIDAWTLRLDGAPVVVKGSAGKLLAAMEDFNKDGFMDLVVKFVDHGNYTPADTEATLTGTLLDGTPIMGTGDICIVQ